MNLCERYFTKLLANEASACIDAWNSGSCGKPAWLLAPGVSRSEINLESTPDSPSWLDDSVLLAGENKPSSHSAFQEGKFYPLDLSSIWEGVSLREIKTPPQNVLDMCAAPGGKTLMTWRRFPKANFTCNEIVSKRNGILKENLQRMGLNAKITQKEAGEWGREFPNTFDLILVDAPCSGQSLPAKGIPAPGCFHKSTINGNAIRQRKILGGVAPALAQGGYLLYTTCTFSREENEKIVEWFLKNHPNFSTCQIADLEPWRSPLSKEFCYRLYPHQNCGAGGFATLFYSQNPLPLENESPSLI